MKKILFAAFAATLLFTSCSKDDNVNANGDSKNLKLAINFGELKTRAMEPSGEGYKPIAVQLELCNSAGTALTYNGRTITDLNVPVNGEIGELLHNIPAATTKIKVYVNKSGLSATSINELQGLSKVPYYGEAEITETSNTDPIDKNKIYTATVDVKIQLSRFEVLGYDQSEKKISITKPGNNMNATRSEAVNVWGEIEVAAAEVRALAAYNTTNGTNLTYAEMQALGFTYELTYTNGSGYFAIPEVKEVYMNSFKLTSNSADVEFNDYDLTSPNGNWASASVTNYTTGSHSNMWNEWIPTGSNKVAGFNLYSQEVADNSNMGNKENKMPHIILKLEMGANAPGTNSRTRWVTIRQFKAGVLDPIIKFENAKAYQMDLSALSLGLYSKKLTVKANGIGDPEEPEEPIDPTDPDPEDDKKGKDLLIVEVKIQSWTIVPITPKF